MGNMGSAHPLVEVNVSCKFEGNPSISKGVIERTRIGDGRTDGPTRQSESSIAPHPHILWWGYKKPCYPNKITHFSGITNAIKRLFTICLLVFPIGDSLNDSRSLCLADLLEARCVIDLCGSFGASFSAFCKKVVHKLKPTSRLTYKKRSILLLTLL